MRQVDVLALLSAGMPDHLRRLEARLLAEFAAGYPEWLAQQERVFADGAPDYLLSRYLLQVVDTTLQQINQRKVRHAEFTRRHANAITTDERQNLILDYAIDLGATKRQHRDDKQAFRRWFAADAINDRFRHRLSMAERRLVLLLQRLGTVVSGYLGEAAEDAEASWRRLALEVGLRDPLLYGGNPHIRESAFKCLSAALRALPEALRECAVSEAMTQFIYRSALESRQDVWLQCDALDLLRTISPENFFLAAKRRFFQPGLSDDFFVRRRITGWLGENPGIHPETGDLLQLAASDSNAYVRQQVASILKQLPAALVAQILPRLLREDPVPQVRAAAALALPDLIEHTTSLARASLLDALAQEKDTFVLRVTMRAAESCVIRLAAATTPSDGQSLLPDVLERLDQIHCASADLRLRRWAAQTMERLWFATDPQVQSYKLALQRLVADCKPGKSKRLPAEMNELPGVLLGRMLAVLAQDSYGMELERAGRGWRLWRGHRFGFRLWRWLHEMRHPSPDKRQAVRHTIGRIFRGSIHAPSAILAELAETKVPGEPLQIGSEGGWRPYLPLVDELISALDEDIDRGPLRIFSSEGITEIEAPRSLASRFRARNTLTHRFAHFARLRNWQEGSQSDARAYLKEIDDLGLHIRFRPHTNTGSGLTEGDPAVVRFFPAPALVASSDWEAWYRFKNYFFSVFENTLFELALFSVTSMVLFIGRHLYQNRLISRARANIPLVIGGWGTRGKSGTERIKAALFSAMGYSVVSKTTGCEAMFLHGQPFDELREMFLFRPYDKATIWEQHNVVRLAEKLGCEVFLWECMALTPAFVQLLQRRWMKDDIATITNTFPDHEDLQGPAGIDLPQVMTNFIPEKRTLLTSEEQMRPILSTACDALGTRLRGVGWLESGMLTPDILARFPYQEHPDNIALVIALADELGIPEDFALKAMADHVVPDLGVLKTYPAADINGRQISFVNGMSANERFGCLGNWTRLGFDRITPDLEPNVIISTVVNNRADRVARSRVFAGILVDDINADYHFLIGSNLAGLQGYIREAWLTSTAEITLWPAGHEHSPEVVLATFARRLRLAHRPQDVEARLRAMLSGQNLDTGQDAVIDWRNSENLTEALETLGCRHIEDTVRCIAAAALTLDEYQRFTDRLATETDQPRLDADFRDLLWQWFQRKLVVIEDFHASGNQIIGLIAERTPPGLENKVMGIQNIKGTGLDFIYRWQAWDICHRACAALTSQDSVTAERGLSALSSFHEYGVLCEAHVLKSLADARQSMHLQQERQQAELAVIQTNLDAAMRQVRQEMQVLRATGWVEKVLSAVEGFFDAGDAVKRRRRADQIYTDLVDERISHSRAAMELQALNKRQKGSWLYADLQDRVSTIQDRLLLTTPWRSTDPVDLDRSRN
jgi:poly-gamma-glutamate synthase PgsB/CapB